MTSLSKSVLEVILRMDQSHSVESHVAVGGQWKVTQYLYIYKNKSSLLRAYYIQNAKFGRRFTQKPSHLRLKYIIVKLKLMIQLKRQATLYCLWTLLTWFLDFVKLCSDVCSRQPTALLQGRYCYCKCNSRYMCLEGEGASQPGQIRGSALFWRQILPRGVTAC